MSVLKKKRDASDITKEEKEAYEKLRNKFELVPKKNIAARASKKPYGKQGVFSHTAGVLMQGKYAKLLLIATVAFSILYSFLYGFWKIPLLEFGFDRMAEITLIDVIYVAVISIMAGLLAALLKYKIDDNSGAKVGSMGGIFAGFISAICPACQGITIVALGSTIASIPLVFLVPYLWVLQIATIFILGLSLYLTSNSIYTKTCISCGVPAKRNVFKPPKTSTP